MFLMVCHLCFWQVKEAQCSVTTLTEWNLCDWQLLASSLPTFETENFQDEPLVLAAAHIEDASLCFAVCNPQLLRSWEHFG